MNTLTLDGNKPIQRCEELFSLRLQRQSDFILFIVGLSPSVPCRLVNDPTHKKFLQRVLLITKSAGCQNQVGELFTISKEVGMKYQYNIKTCTEPAT